MGKVFSYIRFSSARQSAGDSYARQVEAAKTFCDEKGLEMVPLGSTFSSMLDVLHSKESISTIRGSWLGS